MFSVSDTERTARRPLVGRSIDPDAAIGVTGAARLATRLLGFSCLIARTGAAPRWDFAAGIGGAADSSLLCTRFDLETRQRGARERLRKRMGVRRAIRECTRLVAIQLRRRATQIGVVSGYSIGPI